MKCHFNIKMALLIKKINQHMKELVTYTETVEARLLFVKEGMEKLLEEEDIKQLPSYKLLRQTYQAHLDTVTITPASSKKDATAEIYDTLHQPPQIRNRNKKANSQIKRSIAENATTEYMGDTATKKAAVEEVAEGKVKQRFGTRNAPDFGESMLDDDLGPTKAKPSIVEKPQPPLLVKAEGTVYKVEIQGMTYYLSGKYLYSMDEQLRVGTIGTDFEIGGQHYPIDETINLSCLAPEYGEYYACDNKACILLNDGISLCVGEINGDGDVCLFV